MPVNVADQGKAPTLVRVLDPSIRYLLGDTHYNDPTLRQHWEQDEMRSLIATQPEAHQRTAGKQYALFIEDSSSAGIDPQQ